MEGGERGRQRVIGSGQILQIQGVIFMIGTKVVDALVIEINQLI